MIRNVALGVTLGLSVAVVGAALASGSSGSVDAAAAQGRWIDHACWDCVVTMLATDELVWVGTQSAGVVRHDLRTGAVIQSGLDQGLGGRGIDWLALAPDGGLWAATRVSMITSPSSGVSRFDGITWTAYGKDDGFPDGRVYDIWAESGGTAWVAADAGLVHFDGQCWRTEALPPMPDGTVAPARAVTVVKGGDVFVATDAGLYRNTGSGWLSVSTDALPGSAISRLRADGAGRLWAIVGTGVGRLDLAGGRPWVFDELALAEGRSLARHIEITNDGAVWVFNGGSMWRYEGTQWIPLSNTLPATPTDTRPVAGSVSPSGRIWSGLESLGLAEWTGTNWVQYQAARGPTNLIAFAITADTDDNIWTGFMPMSSRDNLVNRFDGTSWRRFGVADGMLSGVGSVLGVFQNAIDAGDDDSVWIGVEEVGIARHDASGWSTTPITDVVGSAAVIYVVESDDRGGAWIGTSAGAAHFDGAEWSRFSTADGLPNEHVGALAVDHGAEGDIVWFGTDAGAARWDGEGMKVFTTADGLASDVVDAIDIDSEGNVWFASNHWGDGVTRFDGREWRVFTTADGLVANDAWAVVADPRGGVWVASTADNVGGVSRFDGSRWSAFTAADGLTAEAVFDIAIDSRGHVWFATLGGVSEYRPEEAPPTPTATAQRPRSFAYLPRVERP